MRSYFRPLVLIAAVLLVGAFLLAYQLVGFRAPMPGRAFAAFANTLSVLGIPQGICRSEHNQGVSEIANT